MDQKPPWMTAQPSPPAAGVSPSSQPPLPGPPLPEPPLPGPPLPEPPAAGELVLAGAKPDVESSDSRYGSSSDSDDEDFPAGAICPEKCLVGGPGVAGGSAGSPVSFRITSRDDRGTNLKEGGSYVTARLMPGSTAKSAGAGDVETIVRDNKDGTYTATYTVPARGDYQLIVEINASPVGGSPFPVFFSPPEASPSRAQPAEGEAAVTSGAPSGTAPGLPAGVSKEQLALFAAQSPSMLPKPSILGPQAHTAQVIFPTDPQVLDSTVLVGNLNPIVNTDQLKQLFGFCGQVESCNLVGNQRQFAFVQYKTPAEAERGLAMSSMQVADRPITVESARAASLAKPGTEPSFSMLQLHQLAQVQLSQMQQSTLAAQVAQMRANAKANPGSALAPGLPQNSASQKAAALTAIAALSKRLTGGASIASFGQNRDTSPARSKRRRDVSPTIRYRSRSRSRERRREPSREIRSRRTRSRSRSRHRDREPDRARDRDRQREHDRGHDRARQADRERDRERDRARAREHDHRSGDRHRSRGRDESRTESRREREVHDRHGSHARERSSRHTEDERPRSARDDRSRGDKRSHRDSRHHDEDETRQRDQDKRARHEKSEARRDAPPHQDSHANAKDAAAAGDEAGAASVKPSGAQWAEVQPAADGPSGAAVSAADQPATDSEQRKAEEQELRLKALKSLSSLKKMEDSPEDGLDLGEGSDVPALPVDSGHRRHSKSKHGHKKKKHHRRERDRGHQDSDAVANGS